MKTINSYETEKREILKTVQPYRIIRVGELGIITPETFDLDGVPIKFREQALLKFDKVLGINTQETQKDEDLLLKSRLFACKEFKNIRNKELAIVADSKTCEIVDLVPMTSETGIAPEPFFNFAELIMEQGYIPSNISYDTNPINGVTLILEPDNKIINKLAPTEEFITNGLYLNWNLSGIEVGHYFTRLICLNGAMREERHQKTFIHELSDKNTKHFLSILTSGEFNFNAFQSYAKLAENAMQSVASIREISMAHNLLTNVLPDNVEIENITHYQTLMDRYSQNNIELKGKTHLAKSDVNVWDLYNNFTRIVSHNTFTEDDLHATLKMFSFADRLLTKQDIKTYIDIYK